MNSVGKDGPKQDAPAAAAPPEPEEFEPFHKRLFKQAQDALRDYDKQKMSKHLLPKEKLNKAYRLIRRATLTREFLDCEFWKEFMKPALGENTGLKPWEPGDARTLEAVAVDHLFASGKSAFAKMLLDLFQEWIRTGDEAKKIVALDAERREAVEGLN
jgi:hypothetical protein